MVTIEIDNAKCKVEGLTKRQNNMLYDELSYEDDRNIHLRIKNPDLVGIDMRKRLFTPKRCTFPTGLLNRVKGLFNENNVAYKTVNLRKTPQKYNYFNLNVPFDLLRYYQLEVMDIIRAQSSVTASMCTGSGKSLVIMQTVLERGVNTLIIVPTLNLKNQFLGDLNYHFGKKVVGTHKDEKLKEIVVSNIQALQNFDKEWFKHFDQVIIDECHHGAADSYYDLNKKFWGHITYRLFVTATLMRTAGDDLKLEGLVGTCDYSYTALQAISDGFIVPPKFAIYEFNHMPVPSNGWHADYQRHIVDQVARNRKILEVANKFLHHTNKNMLILCNRIEHVDKLHKALPGSRVVTGQTKHNNKVFEEYRMGKIRCLIATSQVLSEGVNIPQIDVLIMCGGYSSEIMMCQATGRIVRTDAERNKRFGIVIDFLDKNQKILERHSRQRLRIFEEHYGKDAIKIIAA